MRQTSYTGNFDAICAAIMSAGFFMYLFINDFYPSVCRCYCNLLFYDWRECVISALGTTRHSLRSNTETWR